MAIFQGGVISRIVENLCNESLVGGHVYYSQHSTTPTRLTRWALMKQNISGMVLQTKLTF